MEAKGRPAEGGGVTLKARREHEASTYDTGSQHRAFDHLADVSCPVLVVHGGDGGFPALVAPTIVETLPQGTLRPMTDLGHFGPLEDPVAFADVVRGFLGDGGAS